MEQQRLFDYIPGQQGPDEVLFESAHVRDKSFWREFYGFSLFKRPFNVVISVFMALYFVGFLFLWIFGGDFSGALIIPIIWVALVAFLYFKNVKISLAREEEISNDTPTVYTIRITNSGMTYTSSLGTKHETDLSKIKKVWITKHYLMLQTPSKLCFTVKKDGFTVGTYEEFCAFLRAKGFKVKTK